MTSKQLRRARHSWASHSYESPFLKRERKAAKNRPPG